MKTYLSVLGRQPEISLAELESLFSDVKKLSPALATFVSDSAPDISRLGGSMKLAEKLEISPLDYLKNLPEGKITLGFSDYSRKSSVRSASMEGLKLKKILSRHGRSVRVLSNNSAVLSTATSHHNQLAEKKNHVEIIKYEKDYFLVIGIQNITAYSRRDQSRPARDARVGMLPPKLAQILINLCGQNPREEDLLLLDPFCGTGVVLQEALLMGYSVIGTDLSERMIEYTKKNLTWLTSSYKNRSLPHSSPLSSTSETSVSSSTPVAAPIKSPETAKSSENPLTKDSACAIMDICVGDAMVFDWQKHLSDLPPSPKSQKNSPLSLSAVACETYLGPPMSTIPPEIKLKSAKDECKPIILGFLKNLAPQIADGTPVVIAVPAWLRENGKYSRLNILDDIENMGYNVMKLKSTSNNPLLYYREGQIVARDILILRKNNRCHM